MPSTQAGPHNECVSLNFSESVGSADHRTVSKQFICGRRPNLSGWTIIEQCPLVLFAISYCCPIIRFKLIPA